LICNCVVGSFGMEDNSFWISVPSQKRQRRCSNCNAGGKHEGGYDAFMTGCIFTQACNHLESTSKIIYLRTGHSNANTKVVASLSQSKTVVFDLFKTSD
ncbi:hypothetical protein AALP_AAs72529U000100, partial [Arabis alpina]